MDLIILFIIDVRKWIHGILRDVSLKQIREYAIQGRSVLHKGWDLVKGHGHFSLHNLKYKYVNYSLNSSKQFEFYTVFPFS